MKPTQKQRTFNGNNFAEQNNNYVKRPQTTKSSRTNTRKHLFSQSQNLQQPSSNSVNINDYPQILQDQSESYPVFQENKKYIQQIKSRHQTLYYTTNYFPSDDEEYHNQNHQQFYQNQRPRSYNIINQIFLNHIHEKNIYDNIDQF